MLATRKTLLAGLLVVSSLVLGNCTSTEPAGTVSGKPRVVAAFYPLQFVAHRVAGGHAQVTSLTPAGVEPHDLELNPGQIISLTGADLLLYLGQGFQPAVEDLLEQMKGDKLDVLAGGKLLEGGDEHADEPGAEPAEEKPEESGFDPHVWLDPSRMVEITRSVEQRLAAIDPDHAGDFKANADGLAQQLTSLDQEMKSGLAECDRREIVTSHTAFGYLAAHYDLEQHGLAGLDPESEPSPQRLAEVADLVKKEGITTIFFESLLPRDLAETIARETGTTTAVLDPIETGPEGGDYLSAMRANLANLRKALDCK